MGRFDTGKGPCYNTKALCNGLLDTQPLTYNKSHNLLEHPVVERTNQLAPRPVSSSKPLQYTELGGTLGPLNLGATSRGQRFIDIVSFS